MRRRWSNWAGNQRCTPSEIHRPSSEPDLAAIVGRAAEAGRRVKVVGSGHSFTPAALTDGDLVRLDRYDRLLGVDLGSGRVTVEAGMTLARLNAEVAAHGLALENLGDIAYQTVAGAISTATHGTGIGFGNLSTQVRALRVVAGDGSVVEVSADDDPASFAASAVGVGALGAISTVTLQCVPAFRLHAVERPERVDAVLDELDERVDGSDHFELFWVPHTGWAITKTNSRTDAPPAPRGRWESLRNDLLYQNLAFGLACRLGRLRPPLVPRLTRMVPSPGRVEYTDRSDRVFASPRLVHFYEMEYAVPREAAVDAVQSVREIVRREGLLLSFPVEVRFVAGDDLALSPAHGRDSCYVAVHVYRGTPTEPYFRLVEDAMVDLGGRPHWGKMHNQTAASLAPRYPQWEAFQAARRRIDPAGTFANAYTDRVLGPVR